MSMFFTDTVTWKTPSTATIGTGGERVKSWSTGTSVTGSFQNQSNDKSFSDNIEAFRQTKIFYCPINSINERDLIVYENKNYEVVGVQKMFNHHLEVLLRIKSTA